ncbi:hypothetical protein DFJ73DRAFT_764235 [Zopfochytrium polystomum]|nr:hypothetical protein DFJ73DRAFT_764235 [Zopfochytrium polystomum]
MTKNKGKQPAADARGPQGGRSPETTRSHRLPETNGTPSGSVIAAASPTAPTVAPQLTADNVSPTSAYATAGTLTRQLTAPEGRSTTVVPTIPPARGPRARGAPHVSFMGANLAVAPVRFTRAEVRQQLQQRGAVANNRAVNQQYYSLQQRAAEYARVATEMRVRRDLEREEQRERAQRASARAAARRAGARNAAARRVATPATPAPVVPVTAALTSVVPAAVPTAVNAPGTTPMDVDHSATPVAEISPNRVITGDLEHVVVQMATVPPCPGLAAISCPIADGFVQLNTKLQGIEEFKSSCPICSYYNRTATPASSTPAAVTPVPSTPAEQDTVMVGTPASLPDRPVNTLAEVAQLNDMQWARFFNDMGTPTPEEIALSSAYSVPGNNALINALATSSKDPPAALSLQLLLLQLQLRCRCLSLNTDKDTLESAIILAERFGSRPVSRSSSPHAEP